MFVLAWSGMRGVVSLAAAFAIPLTVNSGAPFPGRDMIRSSRSSSWSAPAADGLTLPWLITRLESTIPRNAAGTQSPSPPHRTRAARAATEVLDQLVADTDGDRPPSGSRAAEILRAWSEHRANAAWERLGRSDAELGESPSAAFRALRLQMLETERGVFIAERDTGRIDDDVLRQCCASSISRRRR